MVLSNKKLKQKLRAAKAELIAAAEAQNNLNDKDSEKFSNGDSKVSLKILLNPDTQRPTLSKREKRRQKAEQNLEIFKQKQIPCGTEDKRKDELKSADVDFKKKRKRDESETSEKVKENESEQIRKKNKSRNKSKPKKKAGNNLVKKENESEQIRKKNKSRNKSKPKKKAGNNLVKKDQNEGEATGDQLVAKACVTYDGNELQLSKRVYVGGIPYYSTEDDIRSYFEGCGTITDVDCMKFPDTGKFRGIAIITFKTEAATRRALALDGSDMGGLFLKIQPFKSDRVNKLSNFSPAALDGYNRVYVGNLSWDVTENDLRKLFSDCTVTFIRFGEDRDTGEFKGYAHVDFAESLSLNMALKLDQSIVCGRHVRVSCAVPKKGTIAKLKSMPKENHVSRDKVNAVSKVQEDSSVTVCAVKKDQENGNGLNPGSSKIRRRTCYECGDKGHLSSSCPKKQAAVSEVKENSSVTVSAVNKAQENSSVTVCAVSKDQENSSGVNPVSSKLRRRTCYECGEKGHLSSSCPKKQAADFADPGAV